jgi:hypothetical protein
MKEDGKNVCINFRVSEEYKKWLNELMVNEEQNSISDFFNKQILIRKIELTLKKLTNEAKRKAASELKFAGKFLDKMESPCDIEGVYPTIEKELKERWIEELKTLVVAEFGFEEKIEDLSNYWGQIANFASDYSVIKKLAFWASQKGIMHRDVTESED